MSKRAYCHVYNGASCHVPLILLILETVTENAFLFFYYYHHRHHPHSRLVSFHIRPAAVAITTLAGPLI